MVKASGQGRAAERAPAGCGFSSVLVTPFARQREVGDVGEHVTVARVQLAGDKSAARTLRAITAAVAVAREYEVARGT